MSGGKGGEKKQTQETEIDDAMREQGEYNQELGRMIAGLGYQPNRGVTVAGFTPNQEAAFGNVNNGLNAFGMGATANPMAGMPQGETNAQGVYGYSTAPSYDEMVSRLPQDYRDSYAAIYDYINAGSPQQTAKKKESPGGFLKSALVDNKPMGSK